MSIQKPILLIDNYDSYTYNLYQLLSVISGGACPYVIKNDSREFLSIDRIDQSFTAIVISPGPGHPSNDRDFGVSRDLILHSRLPILGVCLGHQGIGHCYGAKVIKAKEPMHGRLTSVTHSAVYPLYKKDDDPSQCLYPDIFCNLPKAFSIVRYHSLVIDPFSMISTKDFPLRITSWTCDDEHVIMGLQHRSLPIYGVQFHPESILTEFGDLLIRNFLKIARYNNPSYTFNDVPTNMSIKCSNQSPPSHHHNNSRLDYKLFIYKMDYTEDTFDKVIFRSLFKDTKESFWVDSSKRNPESGRFSMMGPIEKGYIFYQLEQKQLFYMNGVSQDCSTLKLESDDTFVDYLKRLNGAFSTGIKDKMNLLSDNILKEEIEALTYQFGFFGGWIGMFGYELHEETLKKPEYLGSTMNVINLSERHCFNKNNIDALWAFVDKYILFDHEMKAFYISVLCRNSDDDLRLHLFNNIYISLCSQDEARDWIHATIDLIKPLYKIPLDAEAKGSFSLLRQQPSLIETFIIDSKEDYIQKIMQCKEYIMNGDSYELCLTTKIFIPSHAVQETRTPMDYYLQLRKNNPSPYGFYFRIESLNICICSSSPEEFLKIRTSQDGTMNAQIRPIKGTKKRHSDPIIDNDLKTSLMNDVKNKSENLMIVDLIRHDLGQIARIGTVKVSKLFSIETYANVHQLVSSVTAIIDPNKNGFDAIKAAFPPGSMTGAPKQRSVELLEKIEEKSTYPNDSVIPGRRGFYSGSAGWISVSGNMGLNVIIRTAVIDPSGIEVGAGGAIVHLSNPYEEWEEMLLKGSSVLNSLSIM